MATWAAARALDGPLAAGGAELFEGRRVLELGSGCGLLGVALAGVARSVVLTDFGPGAATAPSDPGRLIPPGLLRSSRVKSVKRAHQRRGAPPRLARLPGATGPSRRYACRAV
ncbi:unnamed protein product [Prorocentrum cordatum]|uniref:Calmodulin-lysine N-methyltransferase n=1 Tax=Prorocentrum cordatum TaxID=2364126 RepID=A0ABN9UE78_9DINO|nr:unnamed protein product [Polarella glacialis]